MYCISFCIGQKTDLFLLEKNLRQHQSHQVNKYKGVLSFILPDDKQLFFFEIGTMVTWNCKRYESLKWLKKALVYTSNPLPIKEVVQDEFSYLIGEQTIIKPHQTSNIDCITLKDNSENIKLSFSYGLSQSIKLNFFEQRLEKLIAKSRPMMEIIEKKSFKKISKRSLHKAIALQLIEKSELNLMSNFQYQPAFFWQHPTLESYYHLIGGYMDVEKRGDTLNKRLDVLNEIHDVILSYNETLHSSRLEIIIVILLMIEIVFGVLNFHF